MARDLPAYGCRELVGEGKEGRVCRLDAHRCIKYYHREKYHQRELANLQRGQADPLLPRLYENGTGYLIREFIEGVPLDVYLARRPLTRDLAEKLLKLLETLRKLGYYRADLRLDHIILSHAGVLRVIDPTNFMKTHRTFPRKLLDGLAKLNQRGAFLAWAERLRPETFQGWRKYLKGVEKAAPRG